MARQLSSPPEAWSSDDGVVLGYASSRSRSATSALGPDAQLRRGTVVYAGSVIGSRLSTGHNVVIREENRIGDDVSIWSNTVIDYGCRIGNRVKIHCNCYVAQFTVLEDDVFLAPGVSIANDIYPGDPDSAALMRGPHIGAGAQIGVNVTILPYVNIGANALIGAGSVVTRDVAPNTVAYGNPARSRSTRSALRDVVERTAASKAHGLTANTAAATSERLLVEIDHDDPAFA
jgi:acetyltransferase-like isoleucine patch superfamily enzyme